MVASACLYPRNTLLLFFVIPVPVWLGVGGFVAYDLMSLRHQRGAGGTMVDSAAHVGGAVSGFLWWYLNMRSRRWH